MKPKLEVLRKYPPSGTELQTQINELRRVAAADITVQDLRRRGEALETAEVVERTGVDVQFHERIGALEKLAVSITSACKEYARR